MSLRAVARRERRIVYTVVVIALALAILRMIVIHDYLPWFARGTAYGIIAFFGFAALRNRKEGVNYGILQDAKDVLYLSAFSVLAVASATNYTTSGGTGPWWVQYAWITPFLIANILSFEYTLKKNSDLAAHTIMTSHGAERGLRRDAANYWAQRVAGEVRHRNIDRPEIAQLVEALKVAGVDGQDWVRIEGEKMRRNRQEAETHEHGGSLDSLSAHNHPEINRP